MKKFLPYLFLIALTIPQFAWIGRCVALVKSEKVTPLIMEELEDLTEEDTNEGSEKESKMESKSKKLFLDEALLHELNTYHNRNNRLFSEYINHYNFIYSTITLLPPELS